MSRYPRRLAGSYRSVSNSKEHARAMTIKLTFEAATAPELEEMVRRWVDELGGGRDPGDSAARLGPGPTDDPSRAGAAPGLTNENYRWAIRAIPPGKVAPYSVVSEVLRGDAKGSRKVAG